MHSLTDRIRVVPAFVLVALILVFTPTGVAQQNLDLRPNLQPFPAGDLGMQPDGAGGKMIVFSTTTWNSGRGQLELIAGAVDPVTGKQNVFQRVYSENGSFVDFLAGQFVWHEEHNHFHFEDYAQYTLETVDAPGGSVRTGSKVTFCLLDNTKVDTHLPNAAKHPIYNTCGQTIQGMSVGWGDTYAYYLEGQSLDFTGNPDGIYKLTIQTDPDNHILETNDSDNTSCVQFQVSGFTVTVLGGCTSGGGGGGGGGVVVSSITPNSGQVGTTASVTIKGSGFTPGIAVGFEGGAGPTPSANNVIVLDANTIVATVTIKNGGSSRDRVWDLRVGSTVLANAFTVLP